MRMRIVSMSNPFVTLDDLVIKKDTYSSVGFFLNPEAAKVKILSFFSIKDIFFE